MCTFVLVKQVSWVPPRTTAHTPEEALADTQFACFTSEKLTCFTSKKLSLLDTKFTRFTSTSEDHSAHAKEPLARSEACRGLRQYVYFCTSKAWNLSTSQVAVAYGGDRREDEVDGRYVPVYVN